MRGLVVSQLPDGRRMHFLPAACRPQWAVRAVRAVRAVSTEARKCRQAASRLHACARRGAGDCRRQSWVLGDSLACPPNGTPALKATPCTFEHCWSANLFVAPCVHHHSTFHGRLAVPASPGAIVSAVFASWRHSVVSLALAAHSFVRRCVPVSGWCCMCTVWLMLLCTSLCVCLSVSTWCQAVSKLAKNGHLALFFSFSRDGRHAARVLLRRAGWRGRVGARRAASRLHAARLQAARSAERVAPATMPPQQDPVVCWRLSGSRAGAGDGVIAEQRLFADSWLAAAPWPRHAQA